MKSKSKLKRSFSCINTQASNADPSIEKILIGNKIDLVDKRVVD